MFVPHHTVDEQPKQKAKERLLFTQKKEKTTTRMQPFLRGRQIAYMISEYLRVTGAHEAVLHYSDLFRVALHGDDIQDFDTRWDEVLLSVSEVPNESILERLYKMRIRESDLLTTVSGMHEQ